MQCRRISRQIDLDWHSPRCGVVLAFLATLLRIWVTYQGLWVAFYESWPRIGSGCVLVELLKVCLGSVVTNLIAKIRTTSKTTFKFGDSSFAVVCPTAWNSLPQSIKDFQPVNVNFFKSKLTAHLFV